MDHFAEIPSHTQEGKVDVVISADTVVVLGDKILEKPKDKEDAFNMIKSLSGKTHQVC
jgi:septum formation protein